MPNGEKASEPIRLTSPVGPNSPFETHSSPFRESFLSHSDSVSPTLEILYA
jgi:hypothetical protein